MFDATKVLNIKNCSKLFYYQIYPVCHFTKLPSKFLSLSCHLPARLSQSFANLNVQVPFLFFLLLSLLFLSLIDSTAALRRLDPPVWNFLFPIWLRLGSVSLSYAHSRLAVFSRIPRSVDFRSLLNFESETENVLHLLFV